MGLLESLDGFKESVSTVSGPLSAIGGVESQESVIPETSLVIESPTKESSQLEILSRTEMVQKYVDSVFSTYNLRSANVSFFGDFAKGTTPYGYVVQKVDNHVFFIKEKDTKRIASAVTLLDHIKTTLREQSSVSIPLCVKRNIEGAYVYSLSVTYDEIIEMKSVHPECEFGYTNTGALQDIQLSIKKM